MARAVAITTFEEGPDALAIQEMDSPTPGPDEIRVRVVAATVNPGDLSFVNGELAPYVTGEAPYVAGMEASGVVDAVGPGATWEVGDRVIVHISFLPEGRGAQSELVVVHSDQAGPAPRGVSLVEAATLPMNGLTARAALSATGCQAGTTLLVTGAAGAVGGYVTQLAAAAGIRVIATATRSDEEIVRGLGAQEFVPRDPDPTTRIRELAPAGVDALVDPAGVAPQLIELVRDGGRVVEVRSSGLEPPRDIAVELVLVSRDHLRDRTGLTELSSLAETGQITLRVARTFAPDDAADAYRLLAARGVRGRLVLVFDDRC